MLDQYIEALKRRTLHTFHIPVLGLAFSVDTPLKVARFGISSVISVVDDVLVERMRKHHALLNGEPFTPISVREHDYRAKRITAYLNLVGRLVERQTARLKSSAFEKGSEIVKYFEMLPDSSHVKKLYNRMLQTADSGKRSTMEDELRSHVVAGDIDVNVMTKIDKVNAGRDKRPLPPEFSDAVAAMRGFLGSELNSSVVLSAGLNPRLFGYMEESAGFLPGPDGKLKKKVILKVSDFRSAYIQGKILAKKGIWCSEFRIESGLNCGGHAFATDGYLLGPILEEFKSKRESLRDELWDLYSAGLKEKGFQAPQAGMEFLITVQGGIGTAREDAFLRDHYGVDGTGWGSPFLLVPEVTNVDDETRDLLAGSGRESFYLSDASPLGVSFNNIRNSSGERQIRQRAEEGKPGAPCTKKFLVSNTEFTKDPICTASNQYQSLKIAELKSLGLPPSELEEKIGKVLEKACLCEGLSATAPSRGKSKELAVTACPGPNLAYFSKISSLEEMVGHIYGRLEILGADHRPNMFIQELGLYVEYLRNEIRKRLDSMSARDLKYLNSFAESLREGIEYYRSLIPDLVEETERYRDVMLGELLKIREELLSIIIPAEAEVLVPVGNGT